jgi:hypothetical protein
MNDEQKTTQEPVAQEPEVGANADGVADAAPVASLETANAATELLATAKGLRFRNPAVAVKLVEAESDPAGALSALAKREPYMLWPRMRANNPEVERTAPGIADRLKQALRMQGKRV